MTDLNKTVSRVAASIWTGPKKCPRNDQIETFSKLVYLKLKVDNTLPTDWWLFDRWSPSTVATTLPLSRIFVSPYRKFVCKYPIDGNRILIWSLFDRDCSAISQIYKNEIPISVFLLLNFVHHQQRRHDAKLGSGLLSSEVVKPGMFCYCRLFSPLTLLAITINSISHGALYNLVVFMSVI